MNRLSQMFEAVFAAVAFAEHGEWDEAVRIADGPVRRETQDKTRQHGEQTKHRRSEDRRPRLRL